MKSLFSLILSISFCLLNAQEVKPFSNLIIGNAGSVMYDNLEPDPNVIPHDYLEYHWTLSIATDVSKWFRMGIQRTGMYSNLDIDKPLALYGAFVQWDYVPKFKNRGYMEINYHYGNYAFTNNELTAYNKNGLHYFGGAAGFDWAFSRHFHLDMGMNISWAHAGEAGWSVFGQPFLGLDIHLFPGKRSRPVREGRNNKRL